MTRVASRAHNVTSDTSRSWQQNLFDIFPDGLDPRNWRVVLNGVQVGPGSLNHGANPAPDDVLIASQVLKR